jgi:hypothetical protein
VGTSEVEVFFTFLTPGDRKQCISGTSFLYKDLEIWKTGNQFGQVEIITITEELKTQI